ncbi:hypothetical protein [Rufibacter roseus]|uniref:Uncharacterized protein n=1 Tax=Rufibacter roseus TaxID=1567108 RepID=A0ABW2DMA7_9BACT|nr:hypothetical protein [Rufibacter roseus]
MKNIVFIFLLLFSCKAFATEQIPDILLYNGKKYEWSGYSPAFKYFEDNNLKAPANAATTTALYRNLIMTYSIENDSLYLTDVEILVRNGERNDFNNPPKTVRESVFKDYFPEKSKVLMDFYNSIHTIPYGEVIRVTENNWTDIHHEKHLVFQIKNGHVVKKLDLDYKELLKFKKRQFNRFKKTKEYQLALQEEAKNLEEFNYFRPKKYSMDEYLQLVILEKVSNIK